jgi:uncharacterized protein DUF6602
MSKRLTNIMDGLQARLEGDLRGTRAAVTHPGAKGEASETDWLRVLNDHLPRRYQADKAFVIDSNGECSDQIDIVIFDRQYSPFLYNQANQRYVPAESVYAVFEAKQDLSRENLLYAGAKAGSVRRLFRTSAPIPYAGGSYQARPLHRIIAGIVAYQSSWTPPLGEALRQTISELSVDDQLDLGCSLINGVFEVRYSEGRANLSVVEGSQSLVQFLFRFLRQIQPIATAPAIDYDVYLSKLAKEKVEETR